MLWSDGGRVLQARGPAYENRTLADFGATTRLLVLGSVGGSQSGPRLYITMYIFKTQHILPRQVISRHNIIYSSLIYFEYLGTW
jgi:hypothetical protein